MCCEQNVLFKILRNMMWIQILSYVIHRSTSRFVARVTVCSVVVMMIKIKYLRKSYLAFSSHNIESRRIKYANILSFSCHQAGKFCEVRLFSLFSNCCSVIVGSWKCLEFLTFEHVFCCCVKLFLQDWEFLKGTDKSIR